MQDKPVSRETIFKDVDLTGLSPEQVAKISQTHQFLRNRAQRNQAAALNKEAAHRRAERILGHVDIDALARAAQSVRDPAIQIMLENEVGLLEYTKHSKPGVEITHYSGDKPRPVQSLFRKVPSDLRADPRNRPSYPVFDKMFQSFLGVSIPPGKEGLFSAPLVRYAKQDSIDEDVQGYHEVFMTAAADFADNLDHGLAARRATMENNPSASNEELDAAFKRGFLYSALLPNENLAPSIAREARGIAEDFRANPAVSHAHEVLKQHNLALEFKEQAAALNDVSPSLQDAADSLRTEASQSSAGMEDLVARRRAEGEVGILAKIKQKFSRS